MPSIQELIQTIQNKLYFMRKRALQYLSTFEAVRYIYKQTTVRAIYKAIFPKSVTSRTITNYRFEDAERVAEIQSHITNYKARPNAKGRIAICTAVVNSYDLLKVPEHPSPEIDYYCFSNEPIDGYGIYKVLPITYFGADSTRTARYIKTHVHQFFSDYEIVIWLDASIIIKVDFMPYINRFMESGKAIAAIKHPIRSTVQEEVSSCIYLAKDDPDILLEQINNYEATEYNQQTPLIETGMLMVRMDDDCAHKFLIKWWQQLDRYSKRDQLSVNYSLDQHDIDVHLILPVGYSVGDYPGFHLVSHVQSTDEETYALGKLDLPADVVNPYDRPSFSDTWNARKSQYDSFAIDIVICIHNALDDVKICLDSVIAARTEHHRVILIDDGSDEETAHYLESFTQAHDKVTLQRSETATGYTKAVNRGLKASSADFVILLNSDTIVAGQWAEKMLDAVLSVPNGGIVGPLSNAASHQSIPNHVSTRNQTAINRLPDDMTIADVNALCEEWTKVDIVPIVPLVHGFCFGVHRKVINTIGYMDEEHFPRGYGEENDYCFRATDAGFNLVIATHTYVYHEKTKSYSSSQRSQLVRQSSRTLTDLHGEKRVKRAIHAIQDNQILKGFRSNATIHLSQE